MKKQVMPFVLAAFALPACVYSRADAKTAPGMSARPVPSAVSTREAMESYARQFDNLRQIDGRCPRDYKLVQLCLLLDTSNSMDGLIDQAKSQLWRIVNELSRMNKRGEHIRLEVALYEYGNNDLSASSGYIRQVTSFTQDLDALSEALFSLDTNGGDEYCGHVIGSSLNRLRWNTSNEGLKLIYIAGNEPFNQGSVNYEVACRWAAERGIVVNTIYCGDYQDGVNSFWKRGAEIGRGSYFAINSDKAQHGIATPYDDELLRLNAMVNKTYIPYGRAGKSRLERQEAQDRNASALSAPVSVERAVTKSSALYKASDWDLVDALEQKQVSIDHIAKKELPEELQRMSASELKGYVSQKQRERSTLKVQIAELSQKRDTYVRQQEHQSGESDSFGAVILKNLRDQAAGKHFGTHP